MTIEKTQKTFASFIKKQAINLILIVLGSLMFALSFPGIFHVRGFSLIAYFSLIPVFLTIRQTSLAGGIFYGAVYGYSSYALFNFWLATFDPKSFLIVPVIYMIYFMALFPLLKSANMLFPKKGYILQVLIWLSYEFLRTKGFLGYSYGVLGYSQYDFTSLIGIADIFGVSGVSLLVVWPSAVTAHMISRDEKLSVLLIRYAAPYAFWLVLFTGSLLYSHYAQVDYSESPVIRTALIQHNIDSWRKGLDTFKEAVASLKFLTDRAIEEDPDLIIWSETAFIPAIEYHLKYRKDRPRYELTRELMDYLSALDKPVILGNNDTRIIGDSTKTYNAMLYFDDDIKGVYRKTHLVPFSEHFPYGDILPGLNKMILETGASYYDKGEERTVFEFGDFRLGGQICFEDTFPYISREAVIGGAQVLVNITNDSWSLEPVAAVQHMGMAVFRSIENRRSMVRSTNGGYTTIIDPNGVRLGELEPLTANYLVGDVPVYIGKTTLFTRWGSWFDKLVLAIALTTTVAGFAREIWKRRKNGR